MLSHPSTLQGNPGIRLVLLVSIRLVALGDSWLDPIFSLELFHFTISVVHCSANQKALSLRPSTLAS